MFTIVSFGTYIYNFLKREEKFNKQKMLLFSGHFFLQWNNEKLYNYNAVLRGTFFRLFR